MTLTLDLNPELEAGLLDRARSFGVAPENYVQYLVEKDVAIDPTAPNDEEGSGMVMENGLLIYGAGSVLPSGYLDDAISRHREERSRRIFGGNS